ncbi:hypothetical protein OTU49_014913 [Cherax quadricarinatus]|uniref:Uncharacterized protein n=1 Tax=Cherax quadricarinatus TaxID=27406 RepID=A0AAW0YRH6_CHEQU
MPSCSLKDNPFSSTQPSISRSAHQEDVNNILLGSYPFISQSAYEEGVDNILQGSQPNLIYQLAHKQRVDNMPQSSQPNISKSHREIQYFKVAKQHILVS